MSHIANRIFGLGALGLSASLVLTGFATAGDGNFVFIEQDSGLLGSGNSLFVDQSAADNSLVAGDTVGSTPATQTGGNNRADITLTGSDGRVVMNQHNTAPGSGLNTATIIGGDLATIVLQQDGFGNTGNLDIGDGENSGALFQFGNNNTGTVTVTGSGSSGILYQEGNGNYYPLEVTGNNASVQWNQVGDGINGVAVVPAQVFSTGGTVIITQTSY